MTRPKQPSRIACRPQALLARAAVAMLAIVAAQAGGEASAQEAGKLTRITGKSPFAGCKADKVAQQEGEVFRNTEIEPFIAADPTDPDNLLVGYQQDRWSDGGARGDVAAVSQDGGASWRAVVVPDVSLCAGGDFLRASDPWVDFSPDGAAYYMSLAFEPDLFSPSGEFLGFGRNGMLVNRSTDGGRSWSKPITLVETDDRRFLHDKNSLTADPTNPSFAYAVWDRLQDFTIPGPKDGPPTAGGARGARARAQWLKDRAAAAGAAAPAQAAVEIFFKGPTLFTRTTNGGKSWKEPRIIFDPGPNAQTINNIVVVRPNGTVIDFFTHIYSNGTARIELLRSFDKGASFERRPIVIDETVGPGTVTPNAQEPVRDAAILFDVAVDPESGALYVVWQDGRFRGVEEVAFSMSTDGGSNWSKTIRINKTPASGNELRQQAFVPAIEVGPDGRLVVTHYDFRNDKSRGELTDYWAVFCDPDAKDCRKAASWGKELRLTATSFDMLDAPVARGYFLGDYMGLARAGDAVYPAFGITTGPNVTDLLTRKITFGSDAVAAAVP